MESRTVRTALLTLTHLAVDFACAFLMFSRLLGAGDRELTLLLYNFCAFALQLPLGILADQMGAPQRFAALGCAVAALSALLPPMAAVLTLGLGNALFHAGGGCEVMDASPNRAGTLGVFVSSGALGLYVGTVLGRQAVLPLLVPILALLLLGALCLLGKQEPERSKVASEQGSALPVLCLFLVVVLRSFGGFEQSYEWKTGVLALLAVVAAAAGKAAGGYLADRVGLRRAGLASLLPAAVLFCFGGVPAAGLAAILLFNLTMPMTLSALSRRFPEHRGACFGLLTFALFLGFLPALFGATLPLSRELTLVLTCLLSLALYLPCAEVRHGK